MFVRWQSRRRRTSQFGSWQEDDVRWSAILAEAVRIGGKPRQRHVLYLIGFTESAAKIARQRAFLWDEVAERLDKLGDRITLADRKKIEAAVAAKLPRPTAAERRNARRWRARDLKWFAERYGHAIR